MGGGGILTLLLTLLIIMGLLFAILMLIPEILLRQLWINSTWLTFGGPGILTSGNIPDTRNMFFLDLIIFFTSNSLVNNVKGGSMVNSPIFNIKFEHFPKCQPTWMIYHHEARDPYFFKWLSFQSGCHGNQARPLIGQTR